MSFDTVVNEKHPRPWKATKVVRTSSTRHVIVDRNGNSVCEVYGETHADAEAVAKFIVRMVGHIGGDGAY